MWIHGSVAQVRWGNGPMSRPHVDHSGFQEVSPSSMWHQRSRVAFTFSPTPPYVLSGLRPVAEREPLFAMYHCSNSYSIRLPVLPVWYFLFAVCCSSQRSWVFILNRTGNNMRAVCHNNGHVLYGPVSKNRYKTCGTAYIRASLGWIWQAIGSSMASKDNCTHVMPGSDFTIKPEEQLVYKRTKVLTPVRKAAFCLLSLSGLSSASYASPMGCPECWRCSWSSLWGNHIFFWKKVV